MSQAKRGQSESPVDAGPADPLGGFRLLVPDPATAPAVSRPPGALIGRALVERVDQVLFERITLGLTLAAAVCLLV